MGDDDDSASLAWPLPTPTLNDELEDDDGLAISGEPSKEEEDDECGLLRRRRDSCEHCSGDENVSRSKSMPPPCEGRDGKAEDAAEDESEDRREALDGWRGN